MESRIFANLNSRVSKILGNIIDSSNKPSALSILDATELLSVRDSASINAIASVADLLRSKAPCGDHVTFVVNRNINFTNACIKKCGFCAFSRTGIDHESYFLPMQEIIRRCKEADALGATELCIQAGLPPQVDPLFYEKLTAEVKSVLPHIKLHAFSPEEVKFVATKNKVSNRTMLLRLKEAGVDSLPGTSAEILDDSVRLRISKGRITTDEWVEIISTAHSLGIPTTATVMYGHVEEPRHVAAHIALIRDIQCRSMEGNNVGFTEFVPLSFVHSEAPIWANYNSEAKLAEGGRGAIRPGPTGSEVIKTHAVARLMLAGHIDNIQVSWVKEGFRMAQTLLNAGVNDLGGTLMNESISTAAGATAGQLATPRQLRGIIEDAGRIAIQRHTDYRPVKIFNQNSEEDDRSITVGHDDLNVVNGAQDTTYDLNSVENAADRFGSFRSMVSDNRFKYRDLIGKGTSKRPFSTVAVSTDQLRQRRLTSMTTNQRNFSTVKDTVVTFSSSHTIVPTYECFNNCSYCNFRRNVQPDASAMIPLATVEDILIKLQAEGDGLSKVDEILVLSGEVAPSSSRRHSWHRHILAICEMAMQRGFLPHTNAGPLSFNEMKDLASVNISMGLMIEQINPRLMKTVHRFAPSKEPQARLAQLKQAGELGVAFTTGILVGIGETHADRLESLLAIKNVSEVYGHIQEVIIQPYSAGSSDRLANEQNSDIFSLTDLPHLIRCARDILPVEIAIQVPPNLIMRQIQALGKTSAGSPPGSCGHSSSASCNMDLMMACIEAGASDLGGISPRDEVNPDYPFPAVDIIRDALVERGVAMKKRLPIYDHMITKFSRNLLDM